MISEEQLTEWERIANESTKGPWYVCGGTVCTVDSNDNRDTCPEPKRHCAELKCFNGKLNGNKVVFPDQEFAAAAREAVPALIAEVQELQEKLKEETKLFADAMHKNAETHLVNGRLTGFLQGVAYRLGVTDAMKTQDVEKLMQAVKEVLDRQEDDLK